MSRKKGYKLKTVSRRRADGIRSLECIKARCSIDEDSGCWTWRGAVYKGAPNLHLAAGVLGGGKRRSMAPPRAAWLFSGGTVTPGRKHCVYHKRCDNTLCCNPEHLAAGTVRSKCRAAAKRGAFDAPERRANLTRVRRMLTPEVVAAVQQDTNAGLTCVAAAVKYGINEETARKIRRGEHPHLRQPVMAGASVFAWRP